MLDNQIDQHKKKIFQALLILTAPAGFIFAAFNLYRGQTTLAMVEVITALVSMFLWLHTNKTHHEKKLQRLALIYILVFYSIMMFAFLISNTSISIYIWALIIPLVSYLLLGIRLGFYITAFFLTVSAGIFFSGHAGHPVLLEKVAYVNIGFCAILIWAISHCYELANNRVKKMLSQQATLDYLTGLYNRSVLAAGFQQCLELSNHENRPIALILFDLDRFKSINDQYGHATGDSVLIQFATLLKHHTPENGLAFRVGGEEFVVLLVAANEQHAKQLAERIRQQTEEIKIQANDQTVVSVSSGVVSCQDSNISIESMLKLADKRMYQAKQQGRNSVVHHD